VQKEILADAFVAVANGRGSAVFLEGLAFAVGSPYASFACIWQWAGVLVAAPSLNLHPSWPLLEIRYTNCLPVCSLLRAASLHSAAFCISRSAFTMCTAGPNLSDTHSEKFRLVCLGVGCRSSNGRHPADAEVSLARHTPSTRPDVRVVSSLRSYVKVGV
jgi:hypothetical protein